MTAICVIESMPRWLRATHEAAGNRGIWPHNGAERMTMDCADAEALCEDDPEWSSIVEGADPAEYEPGTPEVWTE